MTNPYAPPRAAVRDVADPGTKSVLADRGTRLGAAILDSFAFFAMVYGPFLVFGIVSAAAATSMARQSAAGGMFAAGFALGFVGFVVWCSITIRYVKQNGQSIGKKILGIKVVRRDGTPVSFSRLFWLRNFVTWIISLVPLFGLVDSLFIFGESRQCLHDKIADTIVVVA
jgi:uncharacterized RDD family membrane protein YckC